MKKLKYLIFLFTFLLITDVNATDSWTGTNWAINSPNRIEVFAYKNENGSISFPHNTYDSISTSAYGFSGYTTNGWSGYAYNQVSGSGYSLLQYTNSVNFIYTNNSFLSGGDYVTLKGQIMPANAEGSNILNLLSWYIDANYGSDTPSVCSTSLSSVGSMYFANFECSFPRTNNLVLSLHFNNYTGSNQGSTFMIRSDYSDLMYSNDNTSIITGSIGGATQDIINNNNTNTQDIINNQNQNNQDIINNQNQNTQDVIDNQNQNTESTNKTIEEQFKNCRDSVNLFDKNNVNKISGYFNLSPHKIVLAEATKSVYIPCKKNTTYTISKISSNRLFVGYTHELPAQNVQVYGVTGNYGATNATLTTDNDAKYLIVSYTQIYQDTLTEEQILSTLQIQEGSVATPYEPYGKICTNRLDEQTDAINGLNDSITSESLPDTSSSLNDMNNSVASDTPISDLVTMPLTLMNAYINGINSTCTSYNLGNLYGTDLLLPCINISSLIGSELWSIIDVLVSIFLIFNISKLFIGAFDSLTSLKDNFGDLYYHGKHDGGDS